MCAREEERVQWVPFNTQTLATLKALCLLKWRRRAGGMGVVWDQHFTHFLPLQTATYLSETKEDGSQHPLHGTCSCTVAGLLDLLERELRHHLYLNINIQESEPSPRLNNFTTSAIFFKDSHDTGTYALPHNSNEV